MKTGPQFAGGIKQSQTLQGFQVLAILNEAIESKVDFIVYIGLPGNAGTRVAVTAKQFRNTVGAVPECLHEVIHYPASGELYVYASYKDGESAKVAEWQADIKEGATPPIVLTEESTTADVFTAIAQSDAKDARELSAWRLLNKAGEAIAAAAEANGLPLYSIIPIVHALAGKLAGKK